MLQRVDDDSRLGCSRKMPAIGAHHDLGFSCECLEEKPFSFGQEALAHAAAKYEQRTTQSLGFGEQVIIAGGRGGKSPQPAQPRGGLGKVPSSGFSIPHHYVLHEPRQHSIGPFAFFRLAEMEHGVLDGGEALRWRARWRR